MPTYEYRCSACNREFEYQQKMTDPDLVRCEACGKDKLERLISWTSVRSDSWKGALTAPNMREAMKGTTAVDRSRSQRFTDAAPAEPAMPAVPSGDASACAAADGTGGTESGGE
ncbi:MAG TPA: zinc ribbon domain-containing protein [Kofleriaceae bacterium]